MDTIDIEVTQDELTVILEALNEYRMRMGGVRQFLADALLFRLTAKLASGT